MGVIADRDHHIGRSNHVIEMARGVGPHRQFAARCCGHRPGVYLGGGMSPGRGCRQRAVQRFQTATANWLRAEFWVQTNTTRWACHAAEGTNKSSDSGISRR